MVSVGSTDQVLADEARLGDYIALLKPRVMSLVVFTAAVGMAMAPANQHPFLALIALACIAVGAGASGALNMWYDADIDAVMSRTANRPVPRGRIKPHDALAFGVTLSAFSVAFLGLVANWLAAGLLAFTIFFYVVIYTMWLKRFTPQNIVIGGAAGAFPPMVGWAAMTGQVGLDAWIMFAIIFMWTPPHFWALALYKTGDYAAAGIPMLPNVAGSRVTRTHILVYSVLLAIVSLAPLATGLAGWLYGAVAVGMGIPMIVLAAKLSRQPEGAPMKRTARRLFVLSLFYLFAVFGALLADRVLTLNIGIL
ncbi:MAG: protoheme IX farnesyltransferase [Alphaproteobacteria bacterium]|nr:protoheme IX farnesyltransferase [Alphaproteobacteria bacterium]